MNFSLPFDAPGSWHALPIGGAAVTHRLSAPLADGDWITADFYNPHDVLLQLRLELPSAENDERFFELIFGLYPRVRARLRMPVSATKLNYWLLPREGALLKPMCGGDLVDADEVTTLRLRALAGPEEGLTIWQSEWRVTAEEPARLERAESADSPLLDELGQASFRRWPGRTTGAAELSARLEAAAEAPDDAFPGEWSRWGGWRELTFPATGFFRTHHDGRRWWLVDPEGCAFWSAGINCVRPESEAAIAGLEHLLAWEPQDADSRRTLNGGAAAVNFLGANFRRTFGDDWRARWARVTTNYLRRRSVNTIGNWSSWEIGRDAALPYTRPLTSIERLPVPMIFRDFPDVFGADFPAACADWATQLAETRADPAFLGYFLMNEPTWAFSKLTPGAGMLVNTDAAASRDAFADWLAGRYADDAALATAWDFPATFGAVRAGRWARLPDSATFAADAEQFSTELAKRLFSGLADACRAVDPDHLNLGARFAAPPPPWLRPALKTCDVFSFNSYSKIPRPAGAELAAELDRPVLIGEWHFGATDRGLPAAALETVADQASRALAYRRYLETHAAEPWCVGVHWFTLYDQSALGRFDGECYNCGFLDVTQREYPELAEAAQTSHERMYAIAAGTTPVADFPPIGYVRRLSL